MPLTGRSGGACPACSYPRAFSVRAGRDGAALTYCANGCTRSDLSAALVCVGGGIVERQRGAENVAPPRRLGAAIRMRTGSLPPFGTLAEIYLIWRALAKWVASPALRFRGDTPHPEGGRLPAMVALVVNAEGAPVGVHRTYLAADGRGKAKVAPDKASLGPVWGGAIRLADPDADGSVVVGEGIALSEPVVQVRVLGRSEMVSLNVNAFVAVTGNGLGLSEDLVRRFLRTEMDAHTEDPDAREFKGDFLADIREHRTELLAASITIWRWGRHNQHTLTRGVALGGYGQWASWVRDPLLTLGCADPVARIGETKAADPRRQEVANLLQTWHDCHGSNAIQQKQLDPRVLDILDPHGRGRQSVAARLLTFTGTRIAGLTLTRCKSEARWSPATYAVTPIKAEEQGPLPL